MCDFNRLSLLVQMKAYDFLEKQKLSIETTLLIILFNCNGDGRVIEQYQSKALFPKLA